MFFAHDHFLFWFFQFGPDAGVGNWAAFQGDQFTTSGRWANSDFDVLVFGLQINFNFSIDGFEDFEFVDDFQTVVDNWTPALDIDDQGSDQAEIYLKRYNVFSLQCIVARLKSLPRFQVGLDLERFQSVFRGEGLELSLNAHDHWDFGGDGQRETQSGGDFVGHLVEHGNFVEVQCDSVAQVVFHLTHVKVVFVQEGSDQFTFDGQESVILIFEFHVQQGFWFVFFHHGFFELKTKS